jgi:hypothetical protein
VLDKSLEMKLKKNIASALEVIIYIKLITRNEQNKIIKLSDPFLTFSIYIFKDFIIHKNKVYIKH